VTIWLREDDEWPDQATLIIHGGAGGIEFVLDGAIANYNDYRVIRHDGLGYFTVSVFATVHGVEAEAIVDHLVHGSYGTASAGAVTDAFKLIPTSDDDAELPPDIQWLQPYHFDICMPDLADARLVELGPLDDPQLLEACSEHLTPHLERLLRLFERRRKA
jgi:hypothetical protein